MRRMSDYRAELIEIKNICNKYGYGNVMSWISALWRYEERSKGLSVEHCFVPTCPSFIKKKYFNPDSLAFYDWLVDEVMKEMQSEYDPT